MNDAPAAPRFGLDRSAWHRITVEGRIPPKWCDRLEGMAATSWTSETGSQLTRLQGELRDQASSVNIPATGKTKSSGGLSRATPIFGWLPKYNRNWIRLDVLAALTVVALLVPEGMAYAELAGMPPETVFYAAPIVLLLYAMFGTSKQLVVGASSVQAIMSFSIVTGLAPAGTAEFVTLTTALAIGPARSFATKYRYGVTPDVPSAEMLAELHRDLQQAGVALELARVRPAVRHLLDRGGITEKIGSEHFQRRVLEGVLIHLSTSEGQAESLLGLSGSASKALDQVVVEMLVRAEEPQRSELEALHVRLTRVLSKLPAEVGQN